MGFRATLNFRKCKVALNPMYIIFLNFAKSYISSCLSKFYNKVKNSPCHFGNISAKSCNYRGIVTIFGNFIKSQKVSSHQLNFKTNDLVLLFKTI